MTLACRQGFRFAEVCPRVQTPATHPLPRTVLILVGTLKALVLLRRSFAAAQLRSFGAAKLSYFFFSGALRLGLRTNQTFAFERVLDVIPDLRARIAQGQQQLRLIGNVAKVFYQIGTDGAGLQMLHLAGIAATFEYIRQDLLKFCARHLLTLSPAHRRAAFSALLSFSRSRSFILALWS